MRYQTWATNSGGWNFKGADLGCVVCRCTNPDIPKSASPADRIMVLIVTAADIECGGEGVFEVLNHQQLAGHTASSGPHLKVCRYSKLSCSTADMYRSTPIFEFLRRIFSVLQGLGHRSLQPVSKSQVSGAFGGSCAKLTWLSDPCWCNECRNYACDL